MKKLIALFALSLAIVGCNQKPSTPAGDVSVTEEEALNSAAEILDASNQKVVEGAGAQKE